MMYPVGQLRDRGRRGQGRRVRSNGACSRSPSRKAPRSTTGRPAASPRCSWSPRIARTRSRRSSSCATSSTRRAARRSSPTTSSRPGTTRSRPTRASCTTTWSPRSRPPTAGSSTPRRSMRSCSTRCRASWTARPAAPSSSAGGRRRPVAHPPDPGSRRWPPLLRGRPVPPDLPSPRRSRHPRLAGARLRAAQRRRLLPVPGPARAGRRPGISVLEWAGFRIGDWTFVGLAKFQQAAADPVFWRSLINTAAVHGRDDDAAQHHGLPVCAADLVAGARQHPRASRRCSCRCCCRRSSWRSCGRASWMRSGRPTSSSRSWTRGQADAVPGRPGPRARVGDRRDRLAVHGLQHAALLRRPPEPAARPGGGGRHRRGRQGRQRSGTSSCPACTRSSARRSCSTSSAGCACSTSSTCMTRGGPNRSTEVLATYMYEQAFKFSDMGYASAIALVIVVLSVGRPCSASAGGALRSMAEPRPDDRSVHAIPPGASGISAFLVAVRVRGARAHRLDRGPVPAHGRGRLLALGHPEEPAPENFLDAWDQFGLGPLFLNSILVTVVSVSVAVVLSVLAAYGFARLRFRGSEVLFLLILLGLMIPPAAVIIPLFVEIRTPRPVRHACRAVAGVRRVRVAALDPGAAQLLRGHPAGAAGGGADRRRRRSAGSCGGRGAPGEGAHRHRRHPAVPVLLERLLPGARAAA